MKTIALFIICLAGAIFSFGQDRPDRVQMNINEVKVTPPKFTGEINDSFAQKEEITSIDDYLAKHVVYPEADRKHLIQGIVVVKFTVSPKGELSDFAVINSISREMDEEVIRVLETTNGMWLSGYNNEEPVAMESEVSVAFKINGMRFTPGFEELGIKYFSKGGHLFLVGNNPKKALKYYNKAARYVPNDVNLLLFRGLAMYATGDQDGAIQDWTRIKTLGSSVSDVYLAKASELEGYKELSEILNE